MRRVVVALVVIVVGMLAVPCPGEVVKVTAERTTIYDPVTKESRSVGIQGKRFLVYGLANDWYFVRMTINKEKVFRWIPKADVEVDWGDAKVVQATVTTVFDVNTLTLSNGTRVQFRRVRVPADDARLAQQTLASLKQLLDGKSVTLEFDTSEPNDRGVYEAYVYADGVFVNRLLIEHGCARVSDVAHRGRYDAVLAYHARRAAEAGRGIWAKGEEATAAVTPRTTSSSDPDDSTSTTPRQLTPAQLTQWAIRLQVQVEVRSERTCRSGEDDASVVSVLGLRLRLKDFEGVIPCG